MTPFVLDDLYSLSPAIVLFLGALLLLVADLYLAGRRGDVLAWGGISVAVLAGISLAAIWPSDLWSRTVTPDDVRAITSQMKVTGSGELAAAVEVWQAGGGLTRVSSGEPLRNDLFGATEAREGAAPPREVFSIRCDAFSMLMSALVLVSLLLVLCSSQGVAEALGIGNGEYYFLLLTASSAMIVATATEHLLVFFLAFETFSLALYAMAGLKERRAPDRACPAPSEAATKYFVLGAFATGFLVYGLALLYGVNGTLYLPDLLADLDPSRAYQVAVGFALVLCGLAFKVGAFPFHWWVPDVYQGSATPIAGFMASAVKVAGFALLLRAALAVFRAEGMPETGGWMLWSPLLWGMAALTIVWGNLLALVQRSLKRLLAYSSIAHTGYATLALVAASMKGGLEPEVLSTLPFYLAAYVVMNAGAFAVVAALGGSDPSLDSVRGLSSRRPRLAFSMAVLMVSLAGIPPTAGFAAKLYIFSAALSHGLVGLSIIAILGTLVSMYYYIRVVVLMYMEGEGVAKAPADASLDTLGPALAAGIAAVVTLFIGLFPSWLIEAALESVRSLL